MKKFAVGIVVICTSLSVSAQDLHFSQTAQTPLLINPACAGVYDGWERVIINQRNQWLGSNTQFMTTNVSADINVGKSRMNDRAHLGVGLMFYNDVGGDSQFGNQTGSLTVSGILPMGGSGHILSAGIQGGFGSRKGTLSSVTFMNQWTGSEFDQTLPTGEQNSLNSFRYMEANAGVYYVYDGGQNTFSRNNDFKLQIGFSGYHLNAPELKYTNGVTETERLHRKYVGHAGVVADIVGSKMAIDGSVLQFVQGGHYETIFGMMLRYRFEDGTKITGLSHDAFFGFGVYHRLKDAIIPSVMVDWKGFQLGISYDITVSKLRNAYTGSLEFSLSYTNRHDALFKTKRRRI